MESVAFRDGKPQPPMPVPGSSSFDSISVGHLSCPADNSCVAVGLANRGEDFNTSQAVFWSLGSNGWTTPLPITATENFNLPVSVSCVTPDSCLVVSSGGRFSRFDGARWTQWEDTTASALDSISCVAGPWCVAVGRDSRVTYADGRWSSSPPDRVTALDGTPDSPNRLTAVSCWAVGACVAAGNDNVATTLRDGRWGASVRFTDDPIATFVTLQCPSGVCRVVEGYGMYTLERNTLTDPVNLGDAGQDISCPTPQFCLVPSGSGKTKILRPQKARVTKPASSTGACEEFPLVIARGVLRGAEQQTASSGSEQCAYAAGTSGNGVLYTTRSVASVARKEGLSQPPTPSELKRLALRDGGTWTMVPSLGTHASLKPVAGVGYGVGWIEGGRIRVVLVSRPGADPAAARSDALRVAAAIHDNL